MYMKIKLIDFGLYNWVKDKGDTYLPNRAKYNDAGSDVRALGSFTVSPYSVSKIPLGFGVQIPDGYMGLLLPRSGLNSKGITVLFSPIDSGYRGELAINVYNTTNEPYEIKEGDKIGQLVIVPCVISDFVWELGEERGTNGFGSTDEIVDNEVETIENEGETSKEKELNKLKSMFTLNPQTNRYDYDGDLDSDTLINFVSEDKDGFIINFGKVTGKFDCSELALVSLKGAPTEVGGWVDCSSNYLTSLEGAPKEVGNDFYCFENQLTSLEGGPQKVGGVLDCQSNQLTSLKGAPQEVGWSFYCADNQLTSLEGAPKEIEGNFDCSENQLTSLEGAPQKVGWTFDCSENQLTSLKGAPKEIKGSFYCNDNQLTSLEGAPQIINGSFNCCNNPDLHSLEGIGKVEKIIYTDL